MNRIIPIILVVAILPIFGFTQKHGTISVKKPEQGTCLTTLSGTAWQIKNSASQVELIVNLLPKGELRISRDYLINKDDTLNTMRKREWKKLNRSENYWVRNENKITFHITGMTYSGQCIKPDYIEGNYGETGEFEITTGQQIATSATSKNTWSALLIRNEWMKGK
ncbi:MAG: hypothetical protein COA57_07560 [Flavobacteriales bacterium]|nr:MAG: hypothetical protein COA57_07560 [Flavobacteriales bacterium]